MAINSFIPTVWSETLFKELDKEYIAVKNCSRDFEGLIKSKGDNVKIIGIGPINVFDYIKNTDMTAPETLSDNSRTLVINQAKAFNFQIDDVDKAQQTPKIMQSAMKEAANTLADKADQYVYNLYSQILEDNTITKGNVLYTNVIDLLLQAREKLLFNNVSSNVETVLEVSPQFAAKIIKSKILQSTNNEVSLNKGLLGSFVGFDIYVSNNIVKKSEEGIGECHKCFARTKRAITFAEQVNSVEAYRPEKRFSDAVKGLHLYGAKIVYPKELILLNISLGDDLASS